MKNLFIIKKTIIAVAFIFTASVIPAFAQWDTTTGGNYTGGWDTTTGGNYTGGWDTTTGGNYTGGWDTTSGGNYTGGWDTTSGGNYTGGWDTTSGGNYTGGWDTTSGGNYTGGWDTTSGGNTTGSYTGGWDTTSASYTAVPYTATPYTTTGATSYTVPDHNSYSTTYTGSASYIAPTYTTGGSYTASPSYIIPTYPTNNTVVCSDGSRPVNGSCTRTTTIPVTTNTICSDGSAPINGSCTRVNTIPTNTNVICSDGSSPINGSCTRTTVIPSNTYNYQTCWDGSVIPTASLCPSQYKTCPNGTSIPVTQACYITSTPTYPTYVAPQIVKFNNVVTSVATEISKTSGRCNGIGLIANGAPSTGWFEYGETSNLGRNTATANIGSANTAPFSNVLTNLKPSTRYFCRAVMQNQYGLVKGEIVSFVTRSTAVSYVRPVTVRPVTTHTTIKKPVTNTITCSDGSTVKTKSTSSAALINQGDKLIAVQIEKLDGNLTSGEVVRYKISYKNLADTRLSGVLIKVTLPQEIVLAGATAGNYDLGTRTLTLNQDTVDPYTEGVIMITGNVQKDAPIGKTIVTNVYAAYTVPGTHTQDEVTAYVVGSIMPNQAITAQDTGAKKVIGQNATRGFMPTTLIEWLALLAIMFIIFILGRSVYASYKDDEGSKHH